MKKNITIILLIILSLAFINCTSKPRFKMEDKGGSSAVESAKVAEDYIVDDNGKEFYKEKL